MYKATKSIMVRHCPREEIRGKIVRKLELDKYSLN